MKLFFVQCAGNTPDGMLGPDLSRFWGDTYSTIIPDTIEEVTAQRAAQARAAH